MPSNPDMEVVQEIENFCKKLDEKINREQEHLLARRKKNELDSKMAQELKLNSELTQKLSEISQFGSELDRICSNFESSLTIADSDRTRLENAKETYQIAKELTGIRFDYSAPPDVAKGFIKSEARRILEAFELPADPDALWELVRTASDPAWPSRDKENRPTNK